MSQEVHVPTAEDKDLHEEDEFTPEDTNMSLLRFDKPPNEVRVQPSEKHMGLFFELLCCMDAMDSLTFEDDCVGFIKEQVNLARQSLL